MSKYVSQRQVLASVKLTEGQSAAGFGTTDFDGFYAQVSGGEITASVEKVYTGKSLFPETICAPAEIGDITLTNFTVGEEAFRTVFQKMRQLVGRLYFDITVNVYDCDLQVPGSDRFYSKALLVGLTESDGDASSGTPATYAMTFSISTVAVPSAVTV